MKVKHTATEPRRAGTPRQTTAMDNAPSGNARPTDDLASQLKGNSVALTGRLASMDKDEFVELVESFGGSYASNLAGSTRFLVVGQRDLPIQPTGMLPAALRKARVLNRKAADLLRILSEEQFLSDLGLKEHSQSIHQFHSTGSLTEALGVSRERIVAWVRAGLIKPAYSEHGVWHFEFRQVSAAQALCELARKGVSVNRLCKSLEQLRVWMPEAAQPLETLSLLHGDGRLLVRLADGDLAGFDGQLHFDFTDEPAATGPSMRLTPVLSAADWYALGLKQESEKFFAEAESSYRKALELGGPDAKTCFGLANVLAAQNRWESATERFRQAVEIDPNFSDAWNNLGSALSEQGRHDEAAVAFRQALAIDPEDSRASYNLADTLDDLGKNAEAAPYWRAFLRYNPSGPWADHARSRLRRGG